MPTLYRLDIAPLTPLPLTKAPFFSYRSDTLLPLGTLVEIPFGRRTLRGIVYAGTALPGRAPLWLKPINRVIAPAWLDSGQRAVAEMVSATYYSSLGNTLKHFVFPLPKRTQRDTTTLPKEKVRRTRKRPAEQCLELATDRELQTLLETKVRAQRKKRGLLLILVPDLLLATLLEQRLGTIAPEEIVTLTSQLTPKHLLATWQTLRQGKTKIVIGTRQTLFAPLQNLDEIIILFPEERLSYKQWDMTPHYEAQALARAWAEATGARLTWLTTSLGLAERALFPTAKHSPMVAPLIIDRRQDGKGARAKVFSKILERLFDQEKHGKILLIARERGVAGVLVCQACQTTARCPQCQHILSEHASGHLRCLTCGYTSSIFPKCTKCGHMVFKSFGFGTVRVERELERLVPRSRILRIDRDTLSSRPAWRHIVTRVSQGDFDSLITTREIGSLLPLPPLSLAAILESDQALAFPEFDSEERLLLELKRLSAKLAPGGTLAVQTFTPEERVWRASTPSQSEKLFEALLDERMLLGYPPAAAMIHLSPQKASGLGQKEMGAIRTRLEALLKEYPRLSVTPLFERTVHRRGSALGFILKYPSGTTLPEPVTAWLRRESHHLAIDIHPLRA